MAKAKRGEPEFQLDPDQWGITPIVGRNPGDRLGQLLRRFRMPAHPDVDPSKMTIRAPKRGPVENQMDMFDVEPADE